MIPRSSRIRIPFSQALEQVQSYDLNYHHLQFMLAILKRIKQAHNNVIATFYFTSSTCLSAIIMLPSTRMHACSTVRIVLTKPTSPRNVIRYHDIFISLPRSTSTPSQGPSLYSLEPRRPCRLTYCGFSFLTAKVRIQIWIPAHDDQLDHGRALPVELLLKSRSRVL